MTSTSPACSGPHASVTAIFSEGSVLLPDARPSPRRLGGVLGGLFPERGGGDEAIAKGHVGLSGLWHR